MDFANAAQKETYERVAGYMKELFGEFAKPADSGPSWGLRSGTAWVQIGVYARGEADSLVYVWAWVVLGPERTPELMAHLLDMNVRMRFCQFGMDESGDIVLAHAIRGAVCDKDTLRNSINAVMYTADEEDDKLVARWGGRRATDPAK